MRKHSEPQHQSIKLFTLATSLVLLQACGGGSSAPSTSTPVVVTPPKTLPVFVDGQAQLVAGFQDKTQWIKQELWVETEFDSDGDGKKDRMHVDVTRPRQTDTENLKVAVIYASSPYYGGGMSNQIMWDVNQELGGPLPPRVFNTPAVFQPVRPVISNDEVDTWVPRGFAVVHSEAPGTGLSQGCPTAGGMPEEYAPKAVIDWLNGRAKGYTSRTSVEEVKANWSTGKVGMTGTSYNGTIPLSAATTGVDGLEVVIPIAPTSSEYHYYRSNGLVRHPGGYLGEDIDQIYDYIFSGDPALRPYCNATYRDGLFMANFDRINGDYNAFWADRDLLNKMARYKAPTLFSHGQHDWNVLPDHSLRMYYALKKKGVMTQLYLHHGGHGGAAPLELRNRWFSHYLYGVDNGVEKDQRALIAREGVDRLLPTAYADFPNPEAAPITLYFGGGGNTIGNLQSNANSIGSVEKFTDNVAFTGGQLAESISSPHRLLYASAELKKPLHLSGAPQIKLRLASSKAAANLSVWLVTLPFDKTKVGSEGMQGVVSRGWADPQNHAALKTVGSSGGNYNSMQAGTPLTPGTFVELTFDLQAHDRIIPAGKRLALMIMSSDREFTLWPKAGTELSIDLSQSQLSLPVVGGTSGFEAAFRP
ncbi:Xaa-Pro dipeptidyl-peptidase [Undibacterium cyanobacteriorum]|uniref:Xaa-Pro dipeptidyl-peptidase n=1 Tax=Undibacterium cyanobacteriorum TaxID=3073561 RepID=A0ABY9RHB4_9BURK|nr:Xaa-Pro dipeptidyl-peptidase [Undibacterium sp. 20NA77.5]WMW79677.1 Xaa-Pro dipeptidyl-peptidase [Undibacterium sp. 20NA77.5]